MRQAVIQKAEERQRRQQPNLTGIPTQMKMDFEQRSGLSFDDVRVHYNSDKPRKIGALAYTQIPQVHIGPGQERHLRHELGHVVQQKQGIVRPDRESTLDTPINTDPLLERQADLWGDGILTSGGTAHIPQPHPAKAFGEPVLQAKHVYTKDTVSVLPLDTTQAQSLEEVRTSVPFNKGSLTMIYESMGTDEGSFSAILAETEKYMGNTLLVFGLNMKCGSFQKGGIKYDEFTNGIAPFCEKYRGIERIIGTHSDTRLVPSTKAATATAKKPLRPEAATATAKKPPRPEAAAATAKKPPRPEAAAAAATSPDTASITDCVHNVCLFPFWWVTPKNTKGYDMPFVEARSLIMQKAEQYLEKYETPVPHFFRWIDGDARDDKMQIDPSLLAALAEDLPAIITGSYLWRTTQSEVTKEYASFIDAVNCAERELRAYYYQLKEKDDVTLSDKYNPDAPTIGIKFTAEEEIEGFYLPETVFMMNSAAHSLAKDVGDHIHITKTQDQESMKTFSHILSLNKMIWVFPLLSQFQVSKPIKKEYEEGSYWGGLKPLITQKGLRISFSDFCNALKNLRQSAFDNSHWFFLKGSLYDHWEKREEIRESSDSIVRKQILLNRARYNHARLLADHPYLKGKITSKIPPPC